MCCVFNGIMKCPKCHNEIQSGYKFCPHCSASLTAKITCPSCGAADIPQDSKYCPYCAAPLASQKKGGQPHVTGTSPVDASKVEKRKGTLTFYYEGTWILFDTKYELIYNGKHVADFSFKHPFRIELPIESEKVTIRVKKSIFGVSCEAKLDPSKNYTCQFIYIRNPRQFHLDIYDESGCIVYSD